jgi:mono/diheme cytochrome c family protein
MRHVLASSRLVIALIAAWLLSHPAPAQSADAAKGRALYEKYCLMCHGPEGRGDGPVGLHANPPAANFHAPESKRKSDAALLESIRAGHPETAMASWGNALSSEQIADILAYIRKLSPPGSGPTDRG